MPSKTPGTQEDWETEVGLPDDFDFWVSRAYFGYQAEYMGGSVLMLIWEGESPDETEVRPIGWSLGTGWAPVNGGGGAEHDKGKTKFNRTSMYGRLIDWCRAAGLDMSQYGSSRDAGTWEGLGFHLVRTEIEFKGAADRGILQDKGGKTTHLMPTSFLGVAVAVVPVPADPAVQAELVALAKRHKSSRQFQMAALRLLDEKGLSESQEATDVLQDGCWERLKMM